MTLILPRSYQVHILMLYPKRITADFALFHLTSSKWILPKWCFSTFSFPLKPRPRVAVLRLLHPRSWSHVLFSLKTSNRIQMTSYKHKVYCRTPDLPKTKLWPNWLKSGHEVLVLEPCRRVSKRLHGSKHFNPTISATQHFAMQTIPDLFLASANFRIYHKRRDRGLAAR